VSEAEQAETISWTDVEKGTGKVELTATQMIGFQLFKIVTGLLGALIVILAAYALLTWPRADEVGSLLEGLEASERAAALRDLRSDWHGEVRSLAQLLVIGPFVPILSAIVGYMFGRNETPTQSLD